MNMIMLGKPIVNLEPVNAIADVHEACKSR